MDRAIDSWILVLWMITTTIPAALLHLRTIEFSTET